MVAQETDVDRRQFFQAAATAVAAAQLATSGSAAGAGTPFPPLKQIDAGVLNVGYAELGPSNGRPVLLLHGWPADSDDVGRAFRTDVGHLFRFKSAGRSD